MFSAFLTSQNYIYIYKRLAHRIKEISYIFSFEKFIHSHNSSRSFEHPTELIHLIYWAKHISRPISIDRSDTINPANDKNNDKNIMKASTLIKNLDLFSSITDEK